MKDLGAEMRRIGIVVTVLLSMTLLAGCTWADLGLPATGVFGALSPPVGGERGGPLIPTFATPTPTNDGFRARMITGVHPEWTYTITVTPSGLGSIIDGYLEVTGAPAATAVSASVVTRREYYENGHGSVGATTLDGNNPGPITPLFSGVTNMEQGFYAVITNYSAAYTWEASATNGASASVFPDGVVFVTGLSEGTPSTVTVRAMFGETVMGTASFGGSSLFADSFESRAGSALPTLVSLGISRRGWRAYRAKCPFAKTCQSRVYYRTRNHLTPHTIETSAMRFRSAKVASRQFTRYSKHLQATGQGSVHSARGTRYAVIGGLGPVNGPGRDLGLRGDSSLVVFAQKQSVMTVFVLTGTTRYMVNNVRRLVAGGVATKLVRHAGRVNARRLPVTVPLK